MAGLRGLGRSGLGVLAVAARRDAPGLWSRYAAARALVPDVLSDPRGFAGSVGRLAASRGTLVVYPGREEALDALLDAPGLPGGAVLPYPAADVVRWVRDKRHFAEMAGAAGLSTPHTLRQATVGELRGASLPLPCLVKAPKPGGAIAFPYVIEDETELRRVLAELPAEQPLLVQEKAPGPLSALSLVLDRRGCVVARFAQQARRTWPPRAGPSSLAVSVAPDEDLVDRVGRMLADAGFWGFAELQFIETGRGPALIDVNPRFYGSLPLALACGVNLPAAWHAVALERPVSVSEPYPVGVTYRWLEADASAALQGFPERLTRRVPGPRVGAIWAGDDPVASALLTARTVTDRFERRVLGRP